MKERKVLITAEKHGFRYVITGNAQDPDTWEHAVLSIDDWNKNTKTDSNGDTILTIDK